MLATGMEIGGYRIDGVLGRGGMGVVYEATQMSLGRTVALKLLAADISEDQAFRERFRREARMQARIDHSHIVTVYEAGEVAEGLFIAMRLIRGANLKQLIRGRQVTDERALRILGAVADALDTAHEGGLIHRDIKPQNILVDRRDHAFLADFGLTKGPGDTGFTRTGQLMGTLDYVSPEQIRGEHATAASDVYAMAAVAYECLTGAPPFARPSEAAVLYAHVAEPPPRPSQSRPDLGAAVDEVVARGLAKQPEDRYAHAGELVAALAEALASPAPEPAPAVAPPAAPVPTPEQTGGSTEIIDRGRAPAPPETGGSTDIIYRDRTPPPPPAAPEEPGEPTGIIERRGAAPGPAAEPSAGPPPEPIGGDTALDHSIGSPTISDRRRPAAPAATEPAPAAPRRRGRPAVLAGGAALAVALGAAGYLAGEASKSDPAPRAPTQRVAAEDLSVRPPAGWHRAAAVPEVPGLSMVRAAAVAPDDDGSAVAFGISDGSGPTLLPATLRDRLDETPEPDATVRLGDLEAYRYDELEPEPGRRLTLFAAPTTSGVVTVACVGGVPRADCDAVAGSLEAAPSLRPVGLGPSDDYAKAIAPALAALRRDRAAAQRRLTRAERPRSQSTAYKAIVRAYSRAAAALDEVDPTPLERDAHARLVAAAERAATAFERLARAARSSDRTGYGDARSAARRADTAAANAVTGLRGLGYEVR